MNNFAALMQEIALKPEGKAKAALHLMAEGYREALEEPIAIARGKAIAGVFAGHKKHIYQNDRIAGSIRGLYTEVSSKQLEADERIAGSFGRNWFWTNSDHFAPDYASFLQEGIGGVLARINDSLQKHPEREKQEFLQGCRIAMQGFAEMIRGYGEEARRMKRSAMTEACLYLADGGAPRSFFEALQLVWLTHVSFLYEERYAMALGRMDQYLYPFYEKDVQSGVLTQKEAVDLLGCTFAKITERTWLGGDDVVNIAIGGVKRDGTGGVNGLSYAILQAVKLLQVPGPNLSARVYADMPDDFLDECLQSIGTGVGYPALMNDEVNIPALQRYGYAPEDCRDYCMVGCIENFLPGQQPPWSDGRFNTPKFIELALNDGRCMLTGVQMGPHTGKAEQMHSMDDFMRALKKQIEYGASEYMAIFRNENERYNASRYVQPFLSCFCQDCIGRGLDINNGGALYPSVHGAGCMGIGTVADSLAALEKVVFVDKTVSPAEMVEAIRADFEGYEELRKKLLNAPKYGNDDEFADRYAIWFVEYLSGIFDRYKTRDGGGIYIAIAANIQNVLAGSEVAATPDGRRARQPLSDAASPTYGMDKEGPTAVIQSVSKPDYSLVACGTVLNQKYSPDMFRDLEKRALLLALIRSYFAKGGQEMQINAVSRQTLKEAMENPEKFENLVVRVSGFSAKFVTLKRAVQEDILQRTEHG